MQVRVLYFASFREAVGKDEESRNLRQGSSARDLWEELARSVPLFARFPAMPPVAINREHSAGDKKLADGDEVAFLPPIAGG